MSNYLLSQYRRVVLLILLAALSACASLEDKTREALTLTQEADIAYQAGRCDSAVPMYRRLMVIMPKETLGLLRIGNCHARNGRDQLAVEAYEEAVQRDPTFVKAWYNLSYLQAKILGKTVARMSASTDPTDPTLEPVRRLSRRVLDAYEAESP